MPATDRPPRRLRARTARVVLAASLVLVVVAPSPATATTGGGIEAVDAFLADRIGADCLPGVAVAITRGDRVVHVAGYGELAADTRFPIGSLGKSFTAVAVLQLVEAGAVALDAPARNYLPAEVLPGDPTVRHLLNQTSGLVEGADPVAGTLAERVRGLRPQSVAAPGSRFRYDNSNYTLLGRLVEVVSRQPFGDYLREHVFEPLGMTDTVAVNTGGDLTALPGVARGHGRVLWQPVEVSVPVDAFYGGSGGVVSTARDMARWLAMQNGAGRIGDQRLLSAEGIRLIHTPPRGVPTNYAMGWGTRPPSGGVPAGVGHAGNLVPYYAEQVIFPESGYGVVVLTNTGLSLLSIDNLESLATGVATLLHGGSPPDVLSVRLKEIGVLVLLLGTTVLLVTGFRRLPRWVDRNKDRSRGRLLLRTLWLLVPAVVLGAGWLFVSSAPARDGVQQIWWFATSLHLVALLLASGGPALALARWARLARRAHET